MFLLFFSVLRWKVSLCSILNICGGFARCIWWTNHWISLSGRMMAHSWIPHADCNICWYGKLGTAFDFGTIWVRSFLRELGSRRLLNLFAVCKGMRLNSNRLSPSTLMLCTRSDSRVVSLYNPPVHSWVDCCYHSGEQKSLTPTCTKTSILCSHCGKKKKSPRQTRE